MSFRELITEEVQGINDTGIGPLIINSIGLISQLHTWHLLAKTHSRHSALGSFYEELQEEVDSLAEKFIAQGGKLQNMNYTINVNYKPSTVVKKSQDYRNTVTEIITDGPELSSMVDSLIKIQDIIDRNLYKFNLK